MPMELIPTIVLFIIATLWKADADAKQSRK